MPKFIKEEISDRDDSEHSLYNDYINKELYKKKMNDKYEIEICFNFYWKNFIKDPKIFEGHNLVGKKLMKLSEDYFISKNKNLNSKDNNTRNFDERVKQIFYKGLIPLDPSAENYLFMKFIKFHFGFLQFINWYEPNRFDKLFVDDNLIKDYLLKNFYVCLEKNKRELKEKLNTLTDFQIISNVCVKERLTLYNYFIENGISQEEAKIFINRQYMVVIKNSNRLPDFSKEKNLNGDVRIQNIMEAYIKKL